MKKKKDNLLIDSMIKQVMIITSLGGFVTLLGSFVDGVLIGRYLGSAAMSSFGLFNPLLLFCIAVSSLFMSGGKIHASNYIGSGKLKEANRVFCIIATMITIVSVTIGVVMFLFAGPLASLLGASSDVSMMQPLVDYIQGLSFGIPAMMIMFCLTTYLQIDGDNARLVLSMIAMVVVNITGDFLCIFVIKNGMFGMGLATSVSNIVGAVIVFSHFASKKSSFRYSIKEVKFNKSGKILYSGVPTIAQRIYSAVSNFAMNSIVLMTAGVIGGAAQSTRGNISALFLTLGSSLGNSTLTVGSLMYGEKDREGLKNSQKRSIAISLKVTIVLSVLMFVFAEPITRIYMGGNEEAMDITVQAIRMFSFSLPFSSICDILAGYYQAIGKIWMANLIPLLEYFVFPVSISYILGQTPLGVFGIWIAYPIAEVLTIIVVVTIAVIYNLSKGKAPLNLAMLNDDFGYRDGDVYSTSIASIEQCVEASVEAERFCKEHSKDKRKNMLIPLSVEELTRNVVQHGFGNKQNATVELKLISEDDKIIIRIRDNCKPFNPKEYKQMLSDDNKEKNIGLRLVYGMITDIEYVSVLNMNNLKIVV